MNSIIRLEYKVDLIIRALQDKGLMLAGLPGLSGIQRDACPVCSKRISITPDFESERLEYTCGCSPPQEIVRGISKLLIPQEEKRYGDSRTDRDSQVLPEPPEDSAGGS